MTEPVALNPIATPLELKECFKPTLKAQLFQQQARKKIQGALSNPEEHIIIVGPCSIHDLDATIEYAKKLKEIEKTLPKNLHLILRVFFEKPRTGHGWTGFLTEPGPLSPLFPTSLHAIRSLLVELTEMELMLATEFLHPLSALYYGDLISWCCVGARTCTSQIHRQMASSLNMTVGFKHCLDGDLSSALLGMEVARRPQIFLTHNEQGSPAFQETIGNPYTHLVLRGSKQGPNYTKEGIATAKTELAKHPQCTQRFLIDCAHDNSGKCLQKQVHIIKELIDTALYQEPAFLGLMLESFLEPGHQAWGEINRRRGVSITDPCLGWETTEALLTLLAKKLC
jgi:phospho-2-dehydro-3-deoxyheptonate aldolase